MIVQRFCIDRAEEEGGVLHGIYHHSMSLKNAVARGVMPPLAVFNDFMACGYDDVALDNGYLAIDSQNPQGAVIEWTPFSLTAEEYDAFLDHIKSLGTPFEVRDIGVSTYQEWFGTLLAPHPGEAEVRAPQSRRACGPGRGHSDSQCPPLRVCEQTQESVYWGISQDNAESLGQALELFRKKLEEKGMCEYAALLSEDRVRNAIHTAIRSYEAVERFEHGGGTDDYFEALIKPICLEIANNGVWPQGCSLRAFFKLVELGITYDGLGLRLQVDTPGAEFECFALPVLDLFYGNFAP